MRVGFICDLPVEHFPFWNDGLRAALDYLIEKYDWVIDVYNIQSLDPGDINSTENYDIGLFWGALSKDSFRFKFFDKQALCFGGGTTYHANIHNFDLIFAESKVDFLDFKRYGVNVVQAFGTNTELFRPMPEQTKIYSYVYPAAFAKWKHHEKFAEYVNTRDVHYDVVEMKPALAFGYMQPNGWEKECYEVCQKAGIAVMPQVPYEVMPWIMNAAENVYVAADVMGGCQRTILEAKACDVEVVVDSDSPKLLELKDLTREEVLDKWDEKSYAEALKKGLESILNDK